MRHYDDTSWQRDPDTAAQQTVYRPYAHQVLVASNEKVIVKLIVYILLGFFQGSLLKSRDEPER